MANLKWLAWNQSLRQPDVTESRALVAKSQPSVSIVNLSWLAGARD